jgi:hypothetical protein
MGLAKSVWRRKGRMLRQLPPQGSRRLLATPRRRRPALPLNRLRLVALMGLFALLRKRRSVSLLRRLMALLRWRQRLVVWQRWSRRVALKRLLLKLRRQ